VQREAAARRQTRVGDRNWARPHTDLERETSLSRYPLVEHRGRIADTEIRKIRPDCIGDVVRRQMGIVLLGHARIGMTKLLGNHGHGDAAHGQL
jgi:hypothetical protein